ncbi:MAG: HepT-like ribonuclease domain-containing protein [Promethearchaeota archaeon]
MQDAVIRELEIIGEASKNLSEESRKKHSKVPWRNFVFSTKIYVIISLILFNQKLYQ